jgi:hypothetical protein
MDFASPVESTRKLVGAVGIERPSPPFQVSSAEGVTGRTPILLLEMLESDLPEHFFETEAANLPVN